MIVPAMGQSVNFFTDRAVAKDPFSGALDAMSFAQVRVCTFNASPTIPCSPVASISDIFGVPLTITGGNFGQLVADGLGRFTFGCTVGQTLTIQVQSTGNNTPSLNYPVTCPASSALTNILGANNVFTGTNSFSAAATFATTTVKSQNNTQFADQFAGADAWVKIAACVVASAGGTCDATGFQGTLPITNIESISTSKVKIRFAPNVVFAFSGAGCSTGGASALLFTGDDVEIVGGNYSTVLDFSACAAGTFPDVLVQGNRPNIHDIKIIGSRGTASTTALQVSSTAGGIFIDSPKIERVWVLNAGANGIYIVRVKKAIIHNNLVQNANVGGILLDGQGNSDVDIDNNWVLDPNVSNTGGTSGIGCVDQGGVLANGHTFVNIHENHVEFTGLGNGRGTECDSVNGLRIVANFYDGNRTAGEQISFTSQNVLVADNHVFNSSIGGILFFANAEAFSDVTIENNTIVNNTTYCVDIGWGANNITATRIHVQGNNCSAQGTGTQSIGIQTNPGASTGAVLSNSNFTNNQLCGGGGGGPINLSGGVTYTNLQLIDGCSGIIGNNAAPWTVIGVKQEIFPETAGPIYVGPLAGFDQCYGDSTSHTMKCSWNNGTFLPIPQVIASGTAVMTTASIPTLNCGTTVAVAATGTLTTDSIVVANNAPVTTATGLLILNKWATANTVNFNYCNPTAGAQTPGAATINWAVRR